MTGRRRAVRPRPGDLEAATRPHPFRPSGEYVGYGQTMERCDLCGLVQRGPGTHHATDDASPLEPPSVPADTPRQPGK